MATHVRLLLAVTLLAASAPALMAEPQSSTGVDRDSNVVAVAPVQPSMNRPDVTVGAAVVGKPIYTSRDGKPFLGTDHPNCADGRHLLLDRGEWRIVASEGTPVSENSFAYVRLACAGPSLVKKDGRWGFLTPDGQLLANRYFDRADAFHEGVAVVHDADMWAVIDEQGERVLGPLRLRGSAR